MITKGGSLLDAVGTTIYLWWFGFRDHTGEFRKSDFAEGVAASRFQSHRIYLHTIWREVCNVHRRIALLHKYKLHRCGICLQTASERSLRPHPQRYKYRLARIESIQTLLTIDPAATLVDLYLLLHTSPSSRTPQCLSEADYRTATESRHHGQHIDCGTTRMEPDTNNRLSKPKP
jgi:hypothetical protein